MCPRSCATWRPRPPPPPLRPARWCARPRCTSSAATPPRDLRSTGAPPRPPGSPPVSPGPQVAAYPDAKQPCCTAGSLRRGRHGGAAGHCPPAFSRTRHIRRFSLSGFSTSHLRLTPSCRPVSLPPSCFEPPARVCGPIIRMLQDGFTRPGASSLVAWRPLCCDHCPRWALTSVPAVL